ncbi:MAG: AraC family transcriptional regulator [Gemmatimonadota bacterium]|nr:AraC family transcriptional regulator [Gemmatimonadota bacterium]
MKTVQVPIRFLDTDLCSIFDVEYPAGIHVVEHAHLVPVLGVLVEGSFLGRFPDHVFECGEESVFTEPPEVPHEATAGPDGAHVVGIKPYLDRDDALLATVPDLFERPTRFPHVGIAKLASRISAELRAPDPTTPIAAQGMALEMLALASRVDPDPDETPAPWVRRAKALLDQIFRQGPTIGELAAEVDVHPARLSRGFRRHYRCSIGEYVRGRRLRWAVEQIQRDAGSLAEIAQRAGYADQSHFTRAFKRSMGVPPGAYRERVR